MPINLKAVVAANVTSLLKLEPGDKGVAKLARSAKISAGDAARVLAGKTSLGLDKIAHIAEQLGVDPWHLCVPNLDVDRLPQIEPLTFRWPFRNVDPEVITGLVGTPAQSVENGLLATLAAVGIAARKPQGKRAA